MMTFECRAQGHNSLIFFLGQYSSSSRPNLASDIQNAFNAHLTPDLIFFVYPSYLDDTMSSLLSDSTFAIDLMRHRHAPVLFISFNYRGELSVSSQLNGNVEKTNKLDMRAVRKAIVKGGYKRLMEIRRDDVLVRSPAGTTFVKPSGQVLEEFIYASQLARDNFENQFLAFSLLPYAPPRGVIDRIYIDTSAISAIAEACVYYLTKFKAIECKHIRYQSFSSYGGLAEHRPDDPEGVWVIISASASTSMGKRIVKDWGVAPNQVVTILSYKKPLEDLEQNKGNAVAFCLDDFSRRQEVGYSPIKVQVQGESFSAEVSRPGTVLVALGHKPKIVDSAIYPYRCGDVLSTFRHSFPVFVDYSKFRAKYTENSILKGSLSEWMRQVVTWAIPRNLVAIIVDTDSDNAHKLLVEDFRKVLRDCEFPSDERELKIYKPNDIEALAKIGERGVLVLSTAIGSGHYFIDVNRSLRIAEHTGMRVFATPFTVAPSRSQHKKFAASLCQGINGFKYSFFSYKVIFVGDKYNLAWEHELRFVTELVNYIGGMEDADGLGYWLGRKRVLEKKGEGLKDCIGCHLGEHTTPLEFSADFVFWPATYELDELNYASVYSTIACVLQNLRENSIQGITLRSNVYQHNVLDPENFVRFNDPLLQSCLWRAALPTELDYRRSESLSTDLERIFCKIFMSSNSARGQVSLDFLLALGIGWIKVTDRSLNKILAAAEQWIKEPHALLLVNYLKVKLG